MATREVIQQGPGFRIYAPPPGISIEELEAQAAARIRTQQMGESMLSSLLIDFFGAPRTREAFQYVGSRLGNILINAAVARGTGQILKIADKFLGKRGEAEQILAFQEVADALGLEELGQESFLSELKQDDPEAYALLQADAAELVQLSQQSAEESRQNILREQIRQDVPRLYEETKGNQSEVYYKMARKLFKKEIQDLTGAQRKQLEDLIQPLLTGLENANAAANPAAGTDATNPDPEAKNISDYLEALRAQRESDEKDDKVRGLLVGQKTQMADNNERTSDEWLARVQELRQNLAGRPLYSKSNYELITAGLVTIPYYSTRVQQ